MASKTGTVSAALRVLDLYTPDRLSWSVPEISRVLGMSYATANRHVNSLKAVGLLEPEGRQVVLSSRFLYLAELVHRSDYLARAGRAAVESVAQRTGETVILNRLVDHHVVGVVRVESHRVVRFSFEPGQRMPLNAGAAAKAILAFMPEVRRDRLLAATEWRAMTPSTITSRNAFLKELERVRDRGWAESHGEVEPDIHAMAVPVFFPWGGVAGSLVVCTPTFRVDDEFTAASLEALRAGAREICDLLGEAARSGSAARGAQP